MRKPNLRSGQKIETSFKATKTEDSDEEIIEEIKANFVRILRKGSSKYEIKFPFKCFSCEEIDHYAAKCPKRAKKNKQRYEKKGKQRRLTKLTMLMRMLVFQMKIQNMKIQMTMNACSQRLKMAYFYLFRKKIKGKLSGEEEGKGEGEGEK